MEALRNSSEFMIVGIWWASIAPQPNEIAVKLFSSLFRNGSTLWRNRFPNYRHFVSNAGKPRLNPAVTYHSDNTRQRTTYLITSVHFEIPSQEPFCKR
jgi:hypothetical protein